MTQEYARHDKENSVLKTLQDQAKDVVDAYVLKHPELEEDRDELISKSIIQFCESTEQKDRLRVIRTLTPASSGFEQMTALFNHQQNDSTKFETITITTYLFVDGSMITENKGVVDEQSRGDDTGDNCIILTASVSVLSQGHAFFKGLLGQEENVPMPCNVIVQFQDDFGKAELKNIKEHLIAEAVIDAVGSNNFKKETRPAVNKIMKRSTLSASVAALSQFLRFQGADPSLLKDSLEHAETALLEQGDIVKDDTYARASQLLHSRLAFSCVDMHFQDEVESRFKFNPNTTVH